MLEKSSTLVLSSAELKEIEQGSVPDRIYATWGLSLPELQAIIRNHQYTLTSENPSFL